MTGFARADDPPVRPAPASSAIAVGAQPSTAPASTRRGALAADLEKCYAIALGSRHPPVLKRLRTWIWNFEIPCIAVYRLGHWAIGLRARHALLALPFLAIYVFTNFFVRLVRHVEVSPRATIGAGFHLGHPSSIFIGPTRIGVNCNVTHNVTIGVGLGAQRMGIPIVGNNVWIGPGATLTGGIVIGDGATISAGSIVTHDVPPGALAAGNPARVVLARYDNKSLLWPDSVT
jgi:serine O-acetyltransferase